MSEGIIYGNHSPSGRLATPAVGHVEELIDQRTATVVAAGRPDIPSTTPYSSAQLAAMPSGTVYRSTDGPQGAWEWRKQGSAWSVVDGDTGWRVLDGSLLNGWAKRTTSPAIHIRRLGAHINLACRSLALAPTAATADEFVAIPAGFEPSNKGYGHVGTANPSNWSYAKEVRYTASTLAVIGYDTNRAGYGFEISWTTSDPWPTTLPGTAV